MQKNQFTQKKNKRRNSKVREDRMEKSFDKKTATNNPTWYAADPALLRDAASIPFSWSVGTKIDLDNPILSQLTYGDEFSIPGICSVNLVPSCGWSDEPTDPINVASTSMYSFIRHANSGHANYDAPDLMLYVLSMTQVYSYINFLQRVYGCATLYAQRNRYLPDALISAMGIDPEDVKSNLANFRYGINVLINKAASMAVPATMSIFQRHATVYQNIYVEGSSIKDQLYFYTPAGFWKYKWNDSDMSGMLEFSLFQSQVHTVSTLLDYGTDMLNRLIHSEDMNIMSGDILKAYGDNIIKMASLPELYPIVPICDPAVLEQIKNATILGELTSLDVVQDSTHGYLKHTPKVRRTGSTISSTTWIQNAFRRNMQTLTESRLLTTNTSDVSPELVIDITRLMTIPKNYEYDESTNTAYVDVYGGSEIATSVYYWQYKINQSTGKWELGIHNATYAEEVYIGAGTDDNALLLAKFRALCVSSAFKYHPAHHYLVMRPGEQEGSFQAAESFVVFDVDNYAVISSQDLEKMHEAALLNELNVPSIAHLR